MIAGYSTSDFVFSRMNEAIRQSAVRSNNSSRQVFRILATSHIPSSGPGTRGFTNVAVISHGRALSGPVSPLRHFSSNPLTRRQNDQHLAILEYYPPLIPENRPARQRDLRRRVYNGNLWVVPDRTSHRECSAAFYRQNPACLHRLVPWINQELSAISEERSFVSPRLLKLVKDALLKYDIPSWNFRRVVEPYTMEKTHHFLHELYHFARSTKEMSDYFDAARYLPKDSVEVLPLETSPPSGFMGPSALVDSSSDESVIDISDESETGDIFNSAPVLQQNCDSHGSNDNNGNNDYNLPLNPSSSSSSSSSSSLSSTSLFAGSDISTQPGSSTDSGNPIVDHSYSHNVASNQTINIIDDFDNPKPGPSGLCKKDNSPNFTITRNDEDGSDTDVDVSTVKNSFVSPKFQVESDSESLESIEIVGYRKPVRERTPEIIDIVSSSSSSEEDDTQPLLKLHHRRSSGSSIYSCKKRKLSHRALDFRKSSSGQNRRHSSRSSSKEESSHRSAASYKTHKERRSTTTNRFDTSSNVDVPSISSSIFKRDNYSSSSSSSDSEELSKENPRPFLRSVVIAPRQLFLSSGSDFISHK